MTEFIKEFWENQARTHGDAAEASWGDHHAVALEIEAIGKHLDPDLEVLDVGCANGHATLQQWQRRRLRRMVGVDYAAAMIAAANSAHLRTGLDERVSFRQGNVLGLDFPDESFDVVYTTRVLINLPTWSDQLRGIAECLRVTRPGGKVILSEGFWEPLMRLNAVRALCHLPPLVEHDFNRYLKASRLEAFLRERDLEFTVDEFSSVYYLGSRLVRELVTNVADWPGYSNPVNKDFFELEQRYSGGGFGIQQAYCIRKPPAGRGESRAF